MNATALPSVRPTRAARILAAWAAWRAEHKLTLEHALEASALVTMLLAWGTGYALLCPAEPVRHRAAQHVAEAR